jgi:tetratricopeptide (TPR) repeat protein
MGMKKQFYFLGLALLLAWPAARSPAADKVKLVQGNQSNGTLTEMTPTEVVIKTGATEKRFPVNDIDWIQFDAEPSDLTQARNAVRAGRNDNALTLLDKIDTAKIERSEIVKDIEFYKALALARLALSGSGSKADAGKKLLAFEKANGDSFHYFETCEALGNLLAGLDKFDQAENYYHKLAEAPWPDYKIRAGVLIGRALVGQKVYDRAIKQFDDVLAIDASGKEAERQKLAATLGRAAALAGAGKTDEAIKSVEAIIAKADAENLELHARAYTILGNCYQAAGKKKEALLAFLHVDLLYSRFPEQHAEALANLATLWAEVDKADRAAQARSLLKEKYPDSEWAKK